MPLLTCLAIFVTMVETRQVPHGSKTYTDANGPISWRIETPKEEWAQAAAKELDFDRYKFEYLLRIGENSVDAWDSTGEPAQDFAGYIRTLIRLDPTIKPTLSATRKNRIVVVSTPTQNTDLRLGGSVYAGTNGEETLDRWWNYMSEASRRLNYVLVQAESDHRFVSVPINLYWHGRTTYVKASPRAQFNVAGHEYEIVEIRAFRRSDRTLTSPEDANQNFRTTVVIRRLNRKTNFVPRGDVETPDLKVGTQADYGWNVDKSGNFVINKPDFSSGGLPSYAFPNSELHVIGEDPPNGITRLATAVNLASVKKLKFGLHYEFRAWLDNIPLDPKK